MTLRPISTHFSNIGYGALVPKWARARLDALSSVGDAEYCDQGLRRTGLDILTVARSPRTGP
jgi:hypothetical protein